MSDRPKIMTNEELDAELKRDRWPDWAPLFDHEKRRRAREDFAENWERTFGKKGS